MNHDDPLHDETGAGEYLGGNGKPVSPRTMQRRRIEGTGPEYVRVGRLIRYRQSALDAYLAARTQHSTSENVPAVLADVDKTLVPQGQA